MIVNPQSFNYRLTIGTLLITIAVLAAYSFTSYSSVKSKETYFEQEKLILQHELVEIIEKYDEINSKNNALNSKLESVNAKAKSVLDSLKVLKMNQKSIRRFKSQVVFLKSQNDQLLKQEKLVAHLYHDLLEEKSLIVDELNQEKDQNSFLEEENERLKQHLEEASLLRANSFQARAFKVKGSTTLKETQHAGTADNFEVCFVIAENVVAPKGPREIYIQVIGPDSNIVSDRGAIEFDNSLLIYSSKEIIEYNNKAIDVCTQIEKETDLKKGTYYVSIFDGQRRLGGTQIELY